MEQSKISHEDLREKLILGLDVDDAAQAYSILDKMAPFIKYYKIGLQLITKDGPRMVMTMKRKGLKVFYDAKFFDIPQTVYNACYEATMLGVNMMNVHALGGPKMISYAKEAIEKAADKLQIEKPKLLAVTILTSMDGKDLKNLSIRTDVKKMVLKLASMAKKSGADGVVCSAHEAKMIKKALGGDFIVVTPGIRPGKAGKDDQKRIMTPKDAIKAGADHIVVARPILQAEDRVAMTEDILKQIKEGIGHGRRKSS